MAEVDRRGFFRILRRADPSAEEARQKEAAAAEQDPRVRELADLTVRLLADADAENEEQLAEGTLMTVPYDLVYMRVTAEHIVFSIETGFSAIIPTKDVRAFDTEPPAEAAGYGNLVSAVLRYHHPADLEHITRSYALRFREDSPLPGAIRAACDLPEPEEPPAEEETASGAEPEPTGGAPRA
jgi:hypothetical protein